MEFQKQAGVLSLGTIASGSEPSALTATTKSWTDLWSNLTEHTNFIKIPPYVKGVCIGGKFSASGANCTIDVYMYRHKADARHTYQATITAGAMQDDDGNYYADTVASITDNSAGSSELNADGNNEQAEIIIDAVGASVMAIIPSSISSGSFTPIISWY